MEDNVYPWIVLFIHTILLRILLLTTDGIKFPVSFKDYEEWLEKNFIVFDKTTAKRNIVTKIITQVVSTTDAANVYKAVRLAIKEVEAHYGESFTTRKVDLDANT
jgi:hypothetical protein